MAGEDVYPLVAKLHGWREAQKVAERAAKDFQREAISQLEADGVDKVNWAYDGLEGTATLVRPTSVILNESALKEVLAADVWDRVVKSSVDAGKLDGLVAEGVVSIEEIAGCYEVVERMPYVRTSAK
jgi:hypothetical protein